MTESMADHRAEQDGGRPMRKRFKLAVWHVVFLWLIAPLVIFVLWRGILFLAVERALGRLRNEGYPTSSEELNAYYKTPISKDNAALLYEEGATLIDNDASEYLDPRMACTLGREEGWEPLPQNWTDNAKIVFAKNREALDLIETASERPDARYSVKYVKVNEEEGQYDAYLDESFDDHSFTEIAYFIRCRADYAALTGDNEGAIRWIRYGWKHFESLASAPDKKALLNQWMECRGLFMLTERILNRCKLSDEQLVELDGVLKSVITDVDLDRIIAGYRVKVIEEFPKSSLSWKKRHFQWDLEQIEYAIEGFDWVGYEYLDQLKTLATIREFTRIAKLKGKVRDDATEQLKTALETLPEEYVHTRRLKGYSLLGQYMDLGDADVACLRTTIGVERYRLAHGGNLPQKLEDLVPRFLPSVPVDRYFQKSFEIWPLDGGYQIYHQGWKDISLTIYRGKGWPATTRPADD